MKLINFYFCLFMYIKAFFNKQYAVFILAKHFVEVLSKKNVLGCLTLPRIEGANETVPLASY